MTVRKSDECRRFCQIGASRDITGLPLLPNLWQEYSGYLVRNPAWLPGCVKGQVVDMADMRIMICHGRRAWLRAGRWNVAIAHRSSATSGLSLDSKPFISIQG